MDGLRAIAVLAVLVHHAYGTRLAGWALGNIGVSVFFSISGFLAYYVLRRDEGRLGHVNYNYFLLRRILRIWPAYFAIIAVAYLTEPSDGHSAANMAQFFTFTLNWDMAFFLPWTNLPHLWSIAVEEQFYVLAPFMYWALHSKYRISFCIVVLLLCNVARVSYIFFENHPTGNGGLYYMTYTYADLFLVGAMVARQYTDGWEPRLATQVACFWVSIIAFPAITKLWAPAIFAPYPWFAALAYALPATVCIPLLICILPNRQTVWSRLLSLPLMQYIGRLSYSLYLVHLYVLYSLLPPNGFPADRDSLRFVVIYISVCCALAQISYHGVELWFLRLKDEKIRMKLIRYPWPAVLICTLLFIGFTRLLFFALHVSALP